MKSRVALVEHDRVEDSTLVVLITCDLPEVAQLGIHSPDSCDLGWVTGGREPFPPFKSPAAYVRADSSSPQAQWANARRPKPNPKRAQRAREPNIITCVPRDDESQKP
ncbi:hypothetical protein NL676_000400 [Syzygium grande]|nr:hypothetical protein NL676_000400 [Syzygium grande]